jgi:hypothetical protein
VETTKQILDVVILAKASSEVGGNRNFLEILRC